MPVSPDDRGAYVLKALPPRGWKVEPSEFGLEIDGENDQCSKGVDLNFEFIGFGITGSVLSKGSENGPQDMKIDLLKGQTVVATALTDADGKYDFFGVTPGDYEVQVDAELAQSLAFDASSRKIHVGEDVGIVQPFTILGFSIEGKVVGVDHSPAKGILFNLINSETKKIVGEIISNSQGQIKFPKIPVGQYLVRLSQDLKNSIELLNSEQSIEVGHANVQLEDFKVKSFNLHGKIQTGNEPMKGVKVKVEVSDKKYFVDSDDKGHFKLTGISTPPLILKANLDGYLFDPLTISKIDPGMNLPALKPIRFRLSGKVDRSGFSQEITVKVTNEKREEIGKVSVTENGQFSIYLLSGKYSVAVEIMENAKIGFAPLEHKIEIQNKPVENLNFHAIKANIEGQVLCLDSCGSNLEVGLENEVSKVLDKVEVDQQGKFKFSGVLPATYFLKISAASDKCWEESSKKISVSKDIKDVKFKQVGYNVKLHSTRQTILSVKGAKTNQEIEIQPGNNEICIKSQDKEVELQTKKSCEEFEINPPKLNFANLQPVSLKPVKFSVSGRINSDSAITDLKMTAKSESRQVNLDLEKDAKGYKFNLMAFPGEELIFSPSSSGHLFDPESLHIFVDDSCHLEVAQFQANKGHFVKGQISPPVEGVKILITNSEPGQKFTQTLTDKSGKYSLGPLPPNEYKVEASKEGYVFEKDSNGFKSKKLASISVHVQDDAQNDLNGVVISVSGGDFRSNTKSEKGKAEFLSLAPGEYFIKPQLKEYEFKPKHKIQKLKEGENIQISWTAKRVSFSIFGKIQSMNGQAEPGTTLKATSKSCGDISEEATSESDGSFRFRGLKPKCEYTISFYHGESIEKLIPKEVKVTMGESDYKLDKPIVAMRAFESMDVLLKISDEVKNVPKTNLKVSVTAKDFNFNVKAVTGQLIPLPRLAKDNKKYQIYVETQINKYSPQKKVSHTFYANDYTKSIKLVLNKTDTGSKSSRKVSSLVYLLPFIVIGLVTFVLWDQRPQFIKNLLENSSSSQPNTRRASNDIINDGWEVVSATPGGSSTAKRRNKKR